MSTSLALPDRRTLPQSLTSLVGQERLALSTMGTAISRAARGYSPRQLLADAHIAASRRAHELCACKRRDRRIVSSLARRARDLVLNLNVKNVRVAVLRASD